MGRLLIFLYGVVSYFVFFGCFIYSIGFLGNLYVPFSIDAEPVGPLGRALLIDLGLLGLFAVQHSVMARPAFKRWWTRFVPEPAERSTYVLLSSLALILMYIYWQPIGGVIWDVESPGVRNAILGSYGLGWVVLLTSTYLINHFDLFGLRQVWLHLRKRPYTNLEFKTPFFYKIVRHPLYVGWLMIFWSTPTMTVAHLVFALTTTAYILIAIQLEERDLVDFHGETYKDYRRRVPMLIPSFRTQRAPKKVANTA